MAKLTFEDLSFNEKGNKIRVNFLRLFYFDLEKGELMNISDFKIEKHSITFENMPEKRARNKFNYILQKGFNNLKNKLNNKKTIYIHKNSGIPLIGNVAFGLIDRGTNIIEVKPITGCNLKCIYCSVDEEKRAVDFIVEEEYLVDEFKKLVEFKGIRNIEAHIASQGEPLLYSPIIKLVRDIASIKEVKTISIDTNGVALSRQLIDQLVDAGLTRFNLSINAFDKGLAQKIACAPYNIDKIKETARYIAKKTKLIIAPVLIPGVNEQEIPKIIQFCREIGAEIGIQNFLNYRFGKNPVKQMDWDRFYEKLSLWEHKFGLKLLLNESDFSITKTKELPKPFKKGDIIKAQIVCNGRLNREKIAVANNRTISVLNCTKHGNIKIRIKRTKHNIFLANHFSNRVRKII